MKQRSPFLALVVALAVAAVATLPSPATASIHSYAHDYFYSVGDAYIFRGGREGLYASTKEVRGFFVERVDDTREELALAPARVRSSKEGNESEMMEPIEINVGKFSF